MVAATIDKAAGHDKVQRFLTGFFEMCNQFKNMAIEDVTEGILNDMVIELSSYRLRGTFDALTAFCDAGDALREQENI